MSGTGTQQAVPSGQGLGGERARQIAYLLAPALVCLMVWWPGLLSWFQRDDFAWLGLHRDLATWPAFWHTMFAPKAQGTIRPLSERAFFLGFWRLFGTNALPYHLLAFFTQFVNLALLASVVRRVTGSRPAGFWSAVLWAANTALASALCWTAAYNEVLCATFLLLSLRFRMSYVETGRARYHAAEWISFLLGFGALELNVVYPALATAYVLACRGRERGEGPAGTRVLPPPLRVWRLAPLWIVSLVYSAVHAWAAPLPSTGVYALHLDLRPPLTAAKYWKMALSPQWFEVPRLPRALLVAAIVAFTVVLLAFALWNAWKGEWMPVFFLSWFWIVLVPVLPLRDHLTKYYLTVPVAGLCALGAWAGVCAWKGGRAVRLAVLLAAGFYLVSQAAGARTLALWHYTQSRLAQVLVTNVSETRRLNPGKTILLADVDDELYLAAIGDGVFRALDISGVYLAPHVDVPGWAVPRLQTATVAELTPARARVLDDLENNRAVVLAARTASTRPVNSLYLSAARRQWTSGPPDRIALGDDLFQRQLGEGWYQAEPGFRWMGRRATLTLAAPRTAGRKLWLRGSLPRFTGRPLTMTVMVAGQVIGRRMFPAGGQRFEAEFDLPATLAARSAMEVTIEMNRALILPPDQRPLGLALTTIEIR